MKTYLAHGGGVNSTALMLLLEQQGVKFESVFVDHGGDYPETYQYIDYLQEHGHPITILYPNIEGSTTIENYCLAKGVKPLRNFRWCTDKFKLRVMRNYIQAPSICYIGIDAGETHRAFKAPLKKGIENRYLLVERNIDRDKCEEIISGSDLPIPGKSCCWMCPNARKSELEYMKRYEPDLYARRCAIYLNADKAYAAKKHKLLTEFI